MLDLHEFLPVNVRPDQLRLCREVAGLTLRELADALGLANGARALREMEQGDKPISGPIARCALVIAGVWPFATPEPDFFTPIEPAGALDEERIDVALDAAIRS